MNSVIPFVCACSGVHHEKVSGGKRSTDASNEVHKILETCGNNSSLHWTCGEFVHKKKNGLANNSDNALILNKMDQLRHALEL